MRGRSRRRTSLAGIECGRCLTSAWSWRALLVCGRITFVRRPTGVGRAGAGAPAVFAPAAHARFVGQPALQVSVITEAPAASTQVNCGVSGALEAGISASGRDRPVQGRGMPLPNGRMELPAPRFKGTVMLCASDPAVTLGRAVRQRVRRRSSCAIRWAAGAPAVGDHRNARRLNPSQLRSLRGAQGDPLSTRT